MVKGLDTFREYFGKHTDEYVLIGGTACDILFDNNNASFRVTRDLDMVLIVEALSKEFGELFWRFVREGGYINKAKSTGDPQFYRFSSPSQEGFPKMIELFARTDWHDETADLTPIHIDDDVSSLSAILLNDKVFEAVEMASMEGTQYLDVEKAEIIGFPEDYSIYDEEELEELEEEIDAGYGTRYFRLPEQHDINDYSIMEDFIYSLPQGEARDRLANTTHGRGAFRRFREGLMQYDLENDWYSFRDEAYMQIARDWCTDNGIRYTEK